MCHVDLFSSSCREETPTGGLLSQKPLELETEFSQEATFSLHKVSFGVN